MPVGDSTNWLWVAEPVRGNIFGVNYQISRSYYGGEGQPAGVADIHEYAKQELFRRIGEGGSYIQAEGSELSAFAWRPVFKCYESWTVNR
jgi:hypothetical protein